MVKLGWLADQVGIVGGAELSGGVLVQNAPSDIEVVLCPSDRRPPGDIEAFVIQNCVTYTNRWINVLEGKLLLKHFRDPWHPGDAFFRRWIMDNVQAVIFNSPLGQDTTPWPYDRSQVDTYYVPPPVDLEVFMQAGNYYEQRHERTKNIFVGRVDMAKGAHRAIDWALYNGEALDMYGTQYHNFGDLPETIRFHGPQPYTKMPQIYGQAKRFVFLPVGPESYSRTTVEAWAAGCEMVVDWPKIGAGWWIENDPGKMRQERAVESFWTVVQDWLQL